MSAGDVVPRTSLQEQDDDSMKKPEEVRMLFVKVEGPQLSERTLQCSCGVAVLVL